jgi:hypothetical protein
LCATGTFILYTSLNEYTQCLVSASTACSYLSDNQLSVRFLDRQQAGNTLDLLGLLSFILASMFYTVAKLEAPSGQTGMESSSLEAESEPYEKKENHKID